MPTDSDLCLPRTPSVPPANLALYDQPFNSIFPYLAYAAGDDALGAGSPTGNGPSEAVMRFRGHRVKVKLTLTHVSWKPLNPHSGCCIERRRMALKSEPHGVAGYVGQAGGWR